MKQLKKPTESVERGDSISLCHGRIIESRIYEVWRRQKLSATPDLSGTVLPYVLFRTQR